jgi:membrane-bound lytic murein transglycosylase F
MNSSTTACAGLRLFLRILYPALLLLFVSCGRGQDPEQSAKQSAATHGQQSTEKKPVAKKVTGNPLRVIVRPEPIAFLPRNAEPVRLDRDIARGLAASLGRRYQPVVVKDYAEMINRLLAGDGDIIAASMTETRARSKRVLFSIPYQHVDELLVVPAGKAAAEAWQDLNGKTICARRDSSYVETLTQMQEQGVELHINLQPADEDTEEIVDKVVSGDCPATVVDSHYWSSLKRYFDGVQALRPLAEDRPIALAMRPDEPELKKEVNGYLIKRALTGRRNSFYTDDLSGLKKRQRLRMITRNGAATYYLYRGSPFGFEYELMQRFARQQGMRLDIVIPDDNESLIPWLNEGRGDVVAAMLTVTPNRTQHASFTRPYFHDEEVVVTRSDDDVKDIQDLAGRTVFVRKSSSYYRTFLQLRAKVPGLRIKFAPEDMQTDEILQRVDEGSEDVTICDQELLEIEQTYGRKLKGAIPVSGETDIAWAVRKSNPELLAALNRFIKKEYRGLFYNLQKQRYFEDSKVIARADSPWRLDKSGRISPFDDVVRKYAARNNLDWRLIVAQIYQESRFHPAKRSWSGAEGLMQLLPRAAREVGVDGKLTDPENSIKAGVRYLRRMIDLFDPKLPLQTRIRFGLASYNAGRGHVLDARRLARRQGLSPDIWYGNVEHAMLLLSKRKYYSKSRFGYVRGSEPVNYVREIEDRYFSYVKQLPEKKEVALD